MIGKRFGRLVVLEDVGRSKDRMILYRCICDCGNEKVIKSKTLRSGESSSCGCYAKEMRRVALQTVSPGDQFSRLKVIKYITGSNWECICECGKIIIVTTNHLTTGNTRSCGCIRLENLPRGKQHHAWNSDKTETDRQDDRKYLEYIAWRVSVFQRDNRKCVLCESEININAHHLNSYTKNITLRIDINNGITLCKKCHIAFHKKYTYYNNTVEQFEEYKNNL